MRDVATLLESVGAPPRRPALAAPEIGPWREGNVLPGVWSFEGVEPGLHVCVVALTHGNEIAGAVLLDRWLRAGLRPLAGRLTLVFANLDAFSRFNPADPTASRFLEEDLNRVWNLEALEGPRRTSELRRARALRPVLDAADVVLDLHSMLWPGDPLFLVGASPEAADLAMQIGAPPLTVADDGHEEGLRLIDYLPPGTTSRRGILLEAGWHWEEETAQRMDRVARRLLAFTGLLPGAPEEKRPETPRLARVVRTVTARSPGFRFTRPWCSGEAVPGGTLLARDGALEIRAPEEGCLLVIPNLLPRPGQTALRIAKLEGGS